MGRNNTLRLDRQNNKFLGVCAGLANFLEVEAWSVRLVFIGCVIFGGWFLVPLYFIVWFLLDEEPSSIKTSMSENLAVKHFRTVDYKKKIYRNTRDAKVLGICAGIADYLEVNAFAVRILFVVLSITAGFFPLIFYFAAWMVLDKQPAGSYSSRSSEQSYEKTDRAQTSTRNNEQYSDNRANTHTGRADYENLQEELHSKRREIKFCARKFVSLQNRLERMEAYVTSSRFKLHREFRNISE